MRGNAGDSPLFSPAIGTIVVSVEWSAESVRVIVGIDVFATCKSEDESCNF
jgi:hypothetical protein